MNWNLEEAISYYRTQGAPGDQSVLIRLLREVQQEKGGAIPAFAIGVIAREYGIKEGILLALIKRIPSLRLGQGHCLELCSGPNCGKHRELAQYAEKLGRESSGKLEVKFVPCMRLCGKGPNIRWDGKLYHKATRELLDELVK